MEVPDLRTWRFGRRRTADREPAPSQQLQMPPYWATGLALWVRTLVGISCLLVPGLFATAMFLTWDGLGRESSDFFVFCVAPPGAVAAFMCLWLSRPNAISGWVRAAVLTPLLQLALIALAWLLWDRYAGRIEDALDRLPLVSALPAPQVALALGAVVLLGALLPRARRHRGKVPTWLRAAVSFALAHVLLLGLWLPVAALCWNELFITHIMRAGSIQSVAPRAVEFAELALLPPTIAAFLFALVSTRWPAWSRKLARRSTLFLAIGLVVALLCRLMSDYTGFLAYANLVHVLLADAVFCLLCVVALGLSHARVLYAATGDTSRPAPWVQRGVIEGERDPSGQVSPIVGALRYHGWLHGMRGRVRRFWLRTDQGLLEVPASARLVAPMPVVSVFAGVGLADVDGVPGGRDCPLLHVGDEVVVSGYVEPTGDGVYRRHALPVPGPDGLLVTRARKPGESVWRDVQLIMWRPCALYLLVVCTAALPGILALALL